MPNSGISSFGPSVRNGVFQPAMPDGVFQPIKPAFTEEIKVGTFKCGLLPNLKRVIAKAVWEHNLDLVFFCEAGGHTKCLNFSGVAADDTIKNNLSKEFAAQVQQNYMSINQATNAVGPVVKLTAGPDIVELRESKTCEHQMAITEYLVRSTNGQAILIVGNAHLRGSDPTKNPSITTRQQLAKCALQEINRRAASSVDQPVAAMLVGEVNLDQQAADEVCQEEEGPSSLENWRTEVASAGLSKDVLFIRGADSKVFDIIIGKSSPTGMCATSTMPPLASHYVCQSQTKP